jgi:hypothetical protein
MAIKYTKWQKYIPNGHIICIYPNLDFWFENKPSGNPGSGGLKVGGTGWRKLSFVFFAWCQN